MNAQEEEFTDKCPAWARKLGVESLRVWQIIEAVMPFAKPDRFDYLDWEEGERGNLTAKEAIVARRVLRAWDEIATKLS